MLRDEELQPFFVNVRGFLIVCDATQIQIASRIFVDVCRQFAQVSESPHSLPRVASSTRPSALRPPHLCHLHSLMPAAASALYPRRVLVPAGGGEARGAHAGHPAT